MSWLAYRRRHDPHRAGGRVRVPDDTWPALVLEGLVDDHGVHALYPQIAGGGYHSGRPAVIDAQTARAWAWALLTASHDLDRHNRTVPRAPDPQLSIFDELSTSSGLGAATVRTHLGLATRG